MIMLKSVTQAWMWFQHRHIPVDEFQIVDIVRISKAVVHITLADREEPLVINVADAPPLIYIDIMTAILLHQQSAVADGCTPYLLVSEENAKGREQSVAASAPRA